MGKLRDVALDVTPLRTSREFRLLWGADGITAAGSQITRVAAAFQVYDLTESTLAVGLLGLVAMFPLFFGSILGGAVADHFERRRVIMLTELGGLLCALALAANAASANPRVWVIFVVFFLTTACYSIGVPASRSAVQMLVEREQIPSATALEAVLGSTARLIGPVIAGVLIAEVGLAWTYLVDVVTFVLSITLLLAMRKIPITGGEGVFLH
jgi:MFS family permease